MPTESTWSESASVVESRPRVKQEVREELREEIRLLDMPRISPEEKLLREREVVEGSVGEVELFEKNWRKTSSETLAEIQRRVDALGASPMPPPPRSPAGAAAMPRPASRPLDVTPAPAPASRSAKPLTARLTPAEQKAVARHVGGEVERIEVLLTTSRGRVAEVAFEKEGKPHKTLVLVGEGGKLSTVDDIAARVDALPLPAAPPHEPEAAEEPVAPAILPRVAKPAPVPPAAALARAPPPPPPPPGDEASETEAEAAPPEEPKKKIGIKFGKKPTPEGEAPEAAPAKKGFGFKLKRKEPAPEAPGAPAPAEAIAAAAEPEGKRKLGLKFGRKQAAEASSGAPAEAPPAEGEAKKRGLFRR